MENYIKLISILGNAVDMSVTERGGEEERERERERDERIQTEYVSEYIFFFVCFSGIAVSTSS